MNSPAAGMLLIDKPTTWSSHKVVNVARRAYGIKRIGHAGTLDPLATGLLIILVGREYTKRQSQFLHQSKRYWCQFQLGTTTTTYDRLGEVVSQAEWSTLNKLDEALVAEVVKSFEGSYQQTVPAFSAVQVKGERLYRKALKGEIVVAELPIRTVTLSELVVSSVKKDLLAQTYLVELEVTCSSGTYIRSLVHDIGQKLEVGAMVKELRRISIGKWLVADAVPGEQLLVDPPPLIEL